MATSPLTQQRAPAAPIPKVCGLATASMIGGLVGLFTVGVGAIIGLGLGIVSLVRIARSAGRLVGRGRAIIGIVLSVASLAALVPLAIYAFDLADSTAATSDIYDLCRFARAYAGHHGGELPPRDTWPQEFATFLRDLPKDAPMYFVADGLPGQILDPGDPKKGRAYAMNGAPGLNLNRLAEPERTVLFFECEFGSSPSGGKELLPRTPRHVGKYLVGFCDGHMDLVPPEKINGLIWEPKAEGQR